LEAIKGTSVDEEPDDMAGLLAQGHLIGPGLVDQP
jgi:hypothetical protein